MNCANLMIKINDEFKNKTTDKAYSKKNHHAFKSIQNVYEG